MMEHSLVPAERCRQLNDAAVAKDGQYVLYWMVANRRSEWNFSLQRAAEWSRQLGKPLLIFEALRTDYPWASDRLHHFVIQGMRDNADRIAKTKAGYFAYLEPAVGAGRGLFRELASSACLVVSDDFP